MTKPCSEAITAYLEERVQTYGTRHNINKQRLYRRALQTVRSHPYDISNGDYAKELRFIGPTLAKEIDILLQAKGLARPPVQVVKQKQNFVEELPKKQKTSTQVETMYTKPTRKNTYKPRFQSPGWGILIALYRNSKTDQHQENGYTRFEIVQSVRNIERSIEVDGNWQIMNGVLVKRNLIVSERQGREKRYQLTKKGRHIARKLCKAREAVLNMDESINYSSESSEENVERVDDTNYSSPTINHHLHHSTQRLLDDTQQLHQKTLALLKQQEQQQQQQQLEFQSEQQKENEQQTPYRSHHQKSPYTRSVVQQLSLSKEDSFYSPLRSIPYPSKYDLVNTEISYVYIGKKSKSMAQKCVNTRDEASWTTYQGRILYDVAILMPAHTEQFWRHVLKKFFIPRKKPPHSRENMMTLVGSIYRKDIPSYSNALKTFILDSLKSSTRVPIQSKLPMFETPQLYTKNKNKQRYEKATPSSTPLIHLQIKSPVKPTKPPVEDSPLEVVKPHRQSRVIESIVISDSDDETDDIQMPTSQSNTISYDESMVPLNREEKSIFDETTMDEGTTTLLDDGDDIYYPSCEVIDPTDFIQGSPSSSPSNEENYQFDYMGQPYKIVFLVDDREKIKYSSVVDALCPRGLEVEKHHLSIGDYLWVARPVHGAFKDAFVFRVIIERKTLHDLMNSLYTRRFYEQKQRLHATQFNDIHYLIEGSHILSPASKYSTHEILNIITKLRLQRHTHVMHASRFDESIEFFCTISRSIASNPLHYLGSDPSSLGSFNTTFSKNVVERPIRFARALSALNGCSEEVSQAIVYRYPCPLSLIRAYEHIATQNYNYHAGAILTLDEIDRQQQQLLSSRVDFPKYGPASGYLTGLSRLRHHLVPDRVSLFFASLFLKD